MKASEARPGRWTGLLLVSLAGAIWGTIGPAVQLVHDRSGLSAVTISAFRAVVAVAALVIFAAVTGRVRSSWRAVRPHGRRVVLIGLLTAAFQLLFFVAVVATGVSVATVVTLGFAPVLLLVIGSVQHRRAPGAGPTVTVVAAVVGLLLVSLAGGADQHAPQPLLGVLAAVGSGTAWAVSAELAGRLPTEIDSFTTTFATMVVAGAVLVPGGLLLTLLRGERLVTADTGSWAAIGYLGVVTMCVAYVVFFSGLRSMSSGAALVATLIEPVVAIAIAVAFLGERLTLPGVVGCLLILTAIASLGRRSEPPPVQ